MNFRTKLQRKYRLLVEKLFLKFPQNVNKTILKYTKNSPSFLALDVLNSVLRRLQKFYADFPRNFGQSQRVSRFFFQKKSSKVSRGHVEPTKDNSRETLLPNFEKCFRSTSAGEGLFCCFFSWKIFFYGSVLLYTMNTLLKNLLARIHSCPEKL